MPSKDCSEFPNVILLIVDTLRADRLVCYGHSRDTSPHIDQIAREGWLFERAYSTAPWTVPSFASIFTGLYPSEHGTDRDHTPLREGLVTLPELLQSRGYQTLGVTTNPWISPESGYGRGYHRQVLTWQLFQRNSDVLNAFLRAFYIDAEKETPGSSRLALMRWLRRLLKGRSGPSNFLNVLYARAGIWAVQNGVTDMGAARAVREAKRLLRARDPDRPFFLSLAFMEPHRPYRPPRSHAQRYLPADLRFSEAMQTNQDAWAYVTGNVPMSEEDFDILLALYDAEVRYQDQKVGEFLGWLKEQGCLDDTLLIITADHGENFGEHGLMAHCWCLYDTLLHVPLIIRWPALYPAGRRWTGLVQTVDIFATIAHLTGGLEPIARQLRHGRSLLPDALADHDRDVVYAEHLLPMPIPNLLARRYGGRDVSCYDRALRAVVSSDHKYIRGSDSSEEFYRLAEDRSESNNLIDSSVDRRALADLRAQMDRIVGDLDTAEHAEHEVESEAMREHLEALGYIT